MIKFIKLLQIWMLDKFDKTFTASVIYNFKKNS